VHAVYLSIKNPFIEADDPFIDFEYIAKKLGQDSAIKYALKVSSNIENTNNWEENYSSEYYSVKELLESKPEEIKNLYVDAFLLFDDKEFTREVKDAGYDGGIFEGVGENSGEQEYHVFDLNQIKSVNNQGTWSTESPDIRFSKAPVFNTYDRRAQIKKVTEADLPAIYEEAKTFNPEKARKSIGKDYEVKERAIGLAKYAMRTLSGRLLEMSPIIRDKMQKHVNKIHIDTANYMRQALPLLEAVKKLPEADYRVFDIASKNADLAEMDAIAEKHGFVKALEGYRGMMNSIIARAKDAGYDTGFLENYFPRIPRDRNQYYKFIRKTPEWGAIQEALQQKAKDLGRDLQPTEQDEYLNQYLRGFAGKNLLGKPGNLKERKMKFIDNEMNSLLEDSILAIPMYIERMHKKIARKELFGNINKDTDMIIDNLDNSIGEYVGNLIRDYKMKASFFSPEHHPFELHHTTFIEKTFGKSFFYDNPDCPRISKDEIEKYQDWANERIYLTGTENGEFPTWDWLFEKFKEQLFSFGIDIFVIDAFNKLAFTGKGNKLDQINEVLTKLTMFAQMNNVIIFLVAHPTKMQKQSDGTYASPTLYDVSGSSDFRNQTHDGFSIYRYFGSEGEDMKTIFENLKTKMKFQGTIGSSVDFSYHIPSGRYYEIGTKPPKFILTEELPEVVNKIEARLPYVDSKDAFGEDYNPEDEIPF